jgi:imidazolonepropionase-like amidohydrolase
MDTIWAFRNAYNKAKHIKDKQDAYCSKVLSGQWNALEEFPEDLQWEALVDVLRGKVKVHTHCYEAVDLDGLVRISNEFKFPIAAFHHAHETYLVPDLLKQSYGHTPAVALFATNARYKREAYRASEFTPRILAEHGIQVAMKSDHDVLNSRYLLYEAQQANFYGLRNALAAVTTTPAEVLGMSHRIGHLNEGWDADLVVWDSHPLAMGATPKQVFIDGIAQLHSPHVGDKPQSFQRLPRVPNFDKEAANAIKYEGLPPLHPKKASSAVLFTNVKAVYIPASGHVQQVFSARHDSFGIVLVHNGVVNCTGLQPSCLTTAISADAQVIDLRGGSINPGLVSFGSPLGLEEINQESSTNDGAVYDPLIKVVPKMLGGDGTLVRAVDGLQYATRDALLAYRAGVTTGITAPTHDRFYGGLGTSFSLGASHKLEHGAIFQEVTGLHVSVRHFGREPSVSTQIAALRRLLLEPSEGLTGEWFKEVKEVRPYCHLALEILMVSSSMS